MNIDTQKVAQCFFFLISVSAKTERGIVLTGRYTQVTVKEMEYW